MTWDVMEYLAHLHAKPSVCATKSPLQVLLDQPQYTRKHRHKAHDVLEQDDLRKQTKELEKD